MVSGLLVAEGLGGGGGGHLLPHHTSTSARGGALEVSL